MFGKKNKKDEERKARLRALQDKITAVLKTEDAGKRYDALETLAAEITAAKDARNKEREDGKKFPWAALSSISGSVPAAVGVGFLLKPFVIADIAITGGLLTGGALITSGVVQLTRDTRAAAEAEHLNDDDKACINEIHKQKQLILEGATPEQLLSSKLALKRLKDTFNPEADPFAPAKPVAPKAKPNPPITP